MRTENEGYLHLYDGFHSWYKHFPQTTEWAEKISSNKLYTHSTSTTAAHLLNGLRWQETQKTESCQLLKVYDLSIIIQCYVIMTTAHVQAAGHERTTIIMLLYWNRVKMFFIHRILRLLHRISRLLKIQWKYAAVWYYRGYM